MEDRASVNTPIQEQIYLEWRAPARPYQKKGKGFMTLPLVIAFLVGVILITAGEWMLIAVVAALVFAYYTWSVVPAELIDYKITSRGLRIAGKLYEWNVFTRWWMETKWEHELLCLETPAEIVGRVVVPLGETKPMQVEKVMNTLLLHERPADTDMDKMGKWLGDKFPLSEAKLVK